MKEENLEKNLEKENIGVIREFVRDNPVLTFLLAAIAIIGVNSTVEKIYGPNPKIEYKNIIGKEDQKELFIEIDGINYYHSIDGVAVDEPYTQQNKSSS